MPKTVQVQLSDSAIKKYAADLNVRELKDPRHPLRFRYRNDRNKGSWHFVRFANGPKWEKAANWPDVPARLMLDALPLVQARLLADPSAPVAVDGWQRVGQVLEWFTVRLATDNNLSKDRKGSSRSLIKCHLLPALGDLPLIELGTDTLDKHLIWPMQADHKLSYVRSALGVLKVAFDFALVLKKITVNPMAGVSFSNFSKAKIKPKGARLRHVAVVDLMAEWADLFPTDPEAVVLAVLMLCHGTRITETRLTKWPNMHLAAREWFLPAKDTKSKRDHVLPLTDSMVAFLERYRTHQKERGYDGVYLFPAATRSGKPMSRSQAFKVFARLGAGEWTSHDLRKLARTCWAKFRIDSLVVKLLLNHSLTDLEATYFQDRGEDIKRDALERWHDWLNTQGFDALQDKTGARRATKPKASDPATWLV